MKKWKKGFSKTAVNSKGQKSNKSQIYSSKFLSSIK